MFKKKLNFVVGIYYQDHAYVAFLALLIEFGVDEFIDWVLQWDNGNITNNNIGKFLDFVVVVACC
jgi:hypothetical protein